MIRKTAYFRALNISLSVNTSKLIIFLTFVAYVLTGNVLTAEKVSFYLNIFHTFNFYSKGLRLSK